jgi:hypothetical protein
MFHQQVRVHGHSVCFINLLGFMDLKCMFYQPVFETHGTQCIINQLIGVHGPRTMCGLSAYWDQRATEHVRAYLGYLDHCTSFFFLSEN